MGRHVGKKILFIVWCFLHQIGTTLAEWTVLFVMQGDNNLSFFMHQNIATLKHIGSTKDVNLLVQWDEPVKHTTWRYKVGQGKLIQDASLPQDMGVNPQQELIDACKWAFLKYPAKKQALILWNHGSGILDEQRDWRKYRGILYDFSSKKCLTNQGLKLALTTIHQEVLNGKKFDLLGMDACLMAMLEIAYQIKDFTHYFVASENIEHAPGWHYEIIVRNLINAPKNYTAAPLAHLIVHSFELFNIDRNSIYTQSALDLSKITLLKENVHELATVSLAHANSLILRKCILAARRSSLEFDGGNFIDLYDFYSKLEYEITLQKAHLREIYPQLLPPLTTGKQLIKQVVIGHRSGRSVARAQGLSIYFPRTATLHLPYYDTLFAQKTDWPLFLKSFSFTEKKKITAQKAVLKAH